MLYHCQTSVSALSLKKKKKKNDVPLGIGFGFSPTRFPPQYGGVKIDDGKLLQADSWHCIPERRFSIPVRASVHVWSFTLQCKQHVLRLTSILDKTILKIHPLPHPAKPPSSNQGLENGAFWASWFSVGGREGEEGRLLPDFILFRIVTPFRNIACGFRLLDQGGHLKSKNETHRYSCASKDHNCYHTRGPCLQVK